MVFDATQVLGVTGKIVMGRDGPDGHSPSSATASIEIGGERQVSPIGRDGDYYFENLRPGTYRASARYLDAVCSFIVKVPASDQAVVDLGLSRCGQPRALDERHGPLRCIALVAGSLAAAGGSARAACTISVTGVVFGSYNVFSPAPLDSTGSVAYICDKPDRGIRITLSTGSSGTYLARTLVYWSGAPAVQPLHQRADGRLGRRFGRH